MITALGILLTQVDKILVSRLLPLSVFASYALAGVLVNALYMLTAPIGAAFYPRFTEIATRGDVPALRRNYHLAAQLVTVVMGSAGIVLIIFSERVLVLWTSNPSLSHQVAPLLQVLAIGTLINGMLGIPYQLQLAHGWTGLTIKINVIAVAVLVPAIYWAVPKFGAIGAAWVWVALNAWYLVTDVYLMHRRLLPKNASAWYWRDVAMPLASATLVAAAAFHTLPRHMTRVGEFAALLMSAASAVAAAAMAAPLIRVQVISRARDTMRLIGLRAI